MDVNDRPSCQEADDPKKKVAGSQEAKEVPEGKHIPRILRWEGPVPFPAIPDTNYASYMLSVLAQYGNQVALVDAATGEHRTYLEVSRVVPRIRAGLEDAGVLPEEAILLITPNHIEFALVLLAVVLQGAACVPVSPDLSPEEVGNIIRVSEAKWAVVHEAGLDKFGAALALLPSRTVKEVWVLSDDPAQHSLPTLMTDELTHKPVQERSFDPRSTAAVILFSSGTTGVPKGVMLSHTNLLAAVLQSKEVRAAGKHGDVNKLESVLLMLPVYHSFGFSLLMSCLFSGGKVVIVRKFVPEQFLHYIHKYQITFLPIVPHIAHFLSTSPLLDQYDLSSLRAIGSGSAPVAPSTLATLTQKSGAVTGQGYGTTECSTTLVSSWVAVNHRSGAVGKILPFIEAKVVNLETGEMLPERQEGELCIRGPTLMMGYANDPKSTAEAIDPDGWFHTGDIVYYDDENFIYITDRLKDIIKVKGLQVCPSELERLASNMEGVAEVVVVGVPSDRFGEVPRAWVVPAPNAHLNPAHLQAYVAERVSAFKQLRGGVEVVHSLPKNSLGKVLRRQLRDSYVSLKSTM